MLISNPFTHDPRVYNEARSLIKAGHEVTVLAWDRQREYTQKEEVDGIHLQRMYNTPLMELLPYDILRLHCWWKNASSSLSTLLPLSSYDAIHCHNLDTLPIGISLKKKLHLPLVYDAHEIWGYMVARDLPRWWASYYLWKEQTLLPHVDRMITVNEPLRDYFSQLTELPISIVMNCKPLIQSVYTPPKNKVFTLLYIGTLGKSRFLHELVDIVRDLPDIACLIGGIGSKQDYVSTLEKKCAATPNATFIGKVPMDQVLPRTQQADAVICMTDPQDPNNRRALANKQFEAMVCGRPIICTANTYPGKLTKQEDVGLVAQYTEKDLRKAIITLKEDRALQKRLGQNALNAALREYNWGKQEEKLLWLYSTLSHKTSCEKPLQGGV